MKRCPECGREYDASMMFCLDDGAELLYGPASFDEPATAVLSVRAREALIEERTQILSDRSPDEPISSAKSIAVLPFKNISADLENEYFCDGLAEEILNALAKIDDLKVAARTSAFSFKDKGSDIGEIGRRLGVATILEGSVRKSGDRLRIAVQLVNASDGYHIWSETFDRMMSDIFDVQDEITLSVVGALKVKLLGETRTSVLRRETENTEAYKAYLRGRYLRYTKNDHAGAAAAFEDAIRLDPSHAPSWLGLAETYVLCSHYSLVDPISGCLKAEKALKEARAIQGDSAESLYINGFMAFVRRDWVEADRAYRRALEIEPNNSRALGTFGIMRSVQCDPDEALRAFETARNSDPLAAYPYAMTGAGLILMRRSEEALTYFDQSFEFEQDQTLALWCCCMASVRLGDDDRAIELAERSVVTSRRADFFLGLLGWTLARLGRTGQAREILSELRERPAGSPTIVFEACLLAELEQIDEAFEVLSRAANEFAPIACYLQLPCFDRLRDDSRFLAHAESVGVPYDCK